MQPLTQPPDPHPRKPRLELPEGACDSHFHLFGPSERYAFDPTAHYASADALPETLFELQRVLGLQRGVVVNGGAYGRNYTHLLDTLARFPQRLRGIALPPDSLARNEILRMHALGVRGVRFVSERRNRSELPSISPMLARQVHDVASWQVHFYPADDLEEQAPRLLALPNTIVLDHFASVKAELGVEQPAFQLLLRLLDTGRVWVKISGPMRCTLEEPPYPSVTPLARALVRHAPQRLLWGSDWPHVNLNGRTMPNDGELVDLIAEWVPDPADRQRILVDNPATLFGF